MIPPFIPPKPKSRPDKVSMWQHIQLFRKDIFSSQPARLYKAWMAEFRLPFFRSYFVNDPDLVITVLKTRPDDFPKSEIVNASLKGLLGTGVFVSNGELWKRQRRIIDPAFEGGRLRDVFPAIHQAGQDAVARLADQTGKPIEIEEQTSKLAADVIFRTLFSIPITDGIAKQTFEKFQEYQRTQPLINVASFFRWTKVIPWLQRRNTRKTAADIRGFLQDLTFARQAEIDSCTAPDDLATKIMTTCDPLTGEKFSADEMVDQVAIFFLAGHETSASALAWTLYLLAVDQDSQTRAAKEAQNYDFTFKGLSQLPFTRDVFREALRLYPPVPMMVRESRQREEFRGREVAKGSQIVLSPWHSHRHTRLWQRPDEFDPNRWSDPVNKDAARKAYMPFSAGPRVCTGAGFAMVEGVVLLACLLKTYRFDVVDGHVPEPVAHLTVRAKEGIYLRLSLRAPDNTSAQNTE